MRSLFKLAAIAAIGRVLGLGGGLSGDTGASPDDAPARRSPWWRPWVGMAVVLAVLAGAGGFLVAASGIVPIKASSGHWPVTRWFLEFSMARSISTHSIGIEAPDLDDESLVVKGAGHYDLGCRPCHGSPAMPSPRIPAAMTPEPPYLGEMVSEWDDPELFYIVRHGVKMTGMPAWPSSQRDDEVWAVVAFLRRLPDLDDTRYRSLAGIGSATAAHPPVSVLDPDPLPPSVATRCAQCHGIDGMSRDPEAFPRLAGQRAAYLAASLRAYAGGRRHSGIMESVAAGLGEEDIEVLARYYAGLPGPSPSSEPDARSLAAGGEIASKGVPGRRVPACAACHGPGAIRTNPIYPSLSGQSAEYLELQLELFQQDRRGGTAWAHIMRKVANRLRPEEIRAVARHYSARSGDGP